MTRPEKDREGAALEALGQLAVTERRNVVEEALDAAHELLDMDIAYFSAFTGGDQVIRDVRGDRGAVALEPGDAIPLEETYCRRMLAGELPNVVHDAQSDPRVSDLPATGEAGIGSYVGVPLQLSDGRVYGTLCCAGSEANERLGRRDVQFMRVLARLIADELERERRSGPEDGRAAPEVPPDAAAAAREAAQTDVPGAILTLDLWFAGAARAAPSARSALEVLSGHLERDRLYDARLLLTELVTNSVRHAGIGGESSIGLAVRLTPTELSVAISDPGPGFRPEVVEPGLEQESGRGLFLVDQLADRWGVGGSPLSPLRGGGGSERGGTTVWFELERAASSEAAA